LELEAEERSVLSGSSRSQKNRGDGGERRRRAGTNFISKEEGRKKSLPRNDAGELKQARSLIGPLRSSDQERKKILKGE